MPESNTECAVTASEAVPAEQTFARVALQSYDVPPAAQPRLISTSENSTFLIEDDTPIGVLRVYRQDNQSVDAMRSELAWIDALRQDGVIHTPAVRRTRGGESIQWVSVDGQSRACALFDHVVGTAPQSDDLQTYGLVGRTAATLHRHVENWPRPSWFTRHRWDLDGVLGAGAIWGQWADGPGVTAGEIGLLARAEAQVKRNLSDYPADETRGGLVHCDLRSANLIKDANAQVWVIDFDDSGFSWYLWDLCSSTTLIEHTSHVGDIVDAWLTGYTQVRPLSRADLAAIPHLVFLRRLHILAWLGSHPESDLAQDLGNDYTVATCGVAERYLSGTFLSDIRG